MGQTWDVIPLWDINRVPYRKRPIQAWPYESDAGKSTFESEDKLDRFHSMSYSIGIKGLFLACHLTCVYRNPSKGWWICSMSLDIFHVGETFGRKEGTVFTGVTVWLHDLGKHVWLPDYAPQLMSRANFKKLWVNQQPGSYSPKKLYAPALRHMCPRLDVRKRKHHLLWAMLTLPDFCEAKFWCQTSGPIGSATRTLGTVPFFAWTIWTTPGSPQLPSSSELHQIERVVMCSCEGVRKPRDSGPAGKKKKKKMLRKTKSCWASANTELL